MISVPEQCPGMGRVERGDRAEGPTTGPNEPGEAMPELTCPNCGTEWSYLGDNPAPSCPECGTDVPAGGPGEEQD